MGALARSRRNVLRPNCRWIQTSQRFSLRTRGSQAGPAWCYQVPPPDVLTMLLRFSRTTSAAQDGRESNRNRDQNNEPVRATPRRGYTRQKRPELPASLYPYVNPGFHLGSQCCVSLSVKLDWAAK